MIKCDKCGAGIPQDREKFHEAWHADLEERFKSIFQGLTGVFDIQRKMTDPL